MDNIQREDARKILKYYGFEHQEHKDSEEVGEYITAKAEFMMNPNEKALDDLIFEHGDSMVTGYQVLIGAAKKVGMDTKQAVQYVNKVLYNSINNKIDRALYDIEMKKEGK